MLSTSLPIRSRLASAGAGWPRSKNVRALSQCADRDERLVQLVREAGGHLPEHRELARMHDFLLRCAQPLLGALALDDLALHPFVRGRQRGRALRDGQLELVVRAPQRVLRVQPRDDGPTALDRIAGEQRGDQERTGDEHEAVCCWRRAPAMSSSTISESPACGAGRDITR